MEASEDLKALSFVRRSLLKKNEKIRELTQELHHANDKIENLKNYQWKCADLEEENRSLRNELSSYSNVHDHDVNFTAGETVDEEEQDLEFEDSKPLDVVETTDEEHIKEEVVEDMKESAQENTVYNNTNNCQSMVLSSDDHHDASLERESQSFEAQSSAPSSSSSNSVFQHNNISAVDVSNIMEMTNEQQLPEGGGSSVLGLLSVDGGHVNLDGSALATHQQQAGNINLFQNTVKGRKKCPLCEKVVTRLKDHMRVHTGERPFTCLQCHMTFTQRTHLVSHAGLVHGTRLPRRRAGRPYKGQTRGDDDAGVPDNQQLQQQQTRDTLT